MVVNPSMLVVLFALGSQLALKAGGHLAERMRFDGPDRQFSGGFEPPPETFGGFGGGSGRPTRVPVVFVPGNGDPARNWDFPPPTGSSHYERFVEAGYRPCELYGVDYLSPAARGRPEANFHQPAAVRPVAAFIEAVLNYTGAPSVDVVAHSLGATVALEAIANAPALHGRVRRFVAIGAAFRGLTSCLVVGPVQPLASTCGLEFSHAPPMFGFHPSTWWAPNPRMGDGGFRDAPARLPKIRFYTLGAGRHDQVHCSSFGFVPGCERTARFDPYPNVRAQLDVGEGGTAVDLDFDLSDWTPLLAAGGDADGVGHFGAKTRTGQVVVRMLTTPCTGTDCCQGYDGVCR